MNWRLVFTIVKQVSSDHQLNVMSIIIQRDNNIQGQEICTLLMFMYLVLVSTRLKWIYIYKYGTSRLNCRLLISWISQQGVSFVYHIRGKRLEAYRCEHVLSHDLIESNLFTQVDLKTVVIRGWVDTSLDKNQDWYVSSVMKVISQRLQLKIQKCTRRDYPLIVVYLMHVISLWIQSIDWPLHG